MRKGVSGFTIVELLIVIVVIAILASISVVAYTGIQARASLSAGKSFDASLRRNLSLERVASFSFDEGSGASANDSSELGNDAVVNGSWASGMESGTALQANNNGTGARITNNIYFGSESFTATAWVNSSDTDGGQSRILGVSIGSPLACYFFINFGNGRPYIEARDCGGAYWSTGTSSSTTDISGKWAHVAAVIDREEGRSSLYINGKLERQSSVVSSSGTFGDSPAPSTFIIGYQTSSATLSLNGLIDDVYIYKSALNLSQINSLYEQQAGRRLAQR